jgi:hypothetical protein
MTAVRNANSAGFPRTSDSGRSWPRHDRGEERQFRKEEGWVELVDWDDLWDCLLVHTGRGRRGLQRYRDVLLTRDGTASEEFLYRNAAEMERQFGWPAGSPLEAAPG